jgi:hypothetical protein
MGVIDFLRGSKVSGVEQDEKVIEITTNGKSALLGGTTNGLEADILEIMKNGHPYTLDNLAERTAQKRPWVRSACNALLHKKFIEVVN